MYHGNEEDRNEQLCGGAHVALAYRDGVQPLKSKGAFEWLVNG